MDWTMTRRALASLLPIGWLTTPPSAPCPQPFAYQSSDPRLDVLAFHLAELAGRGVREGIVFVAWTPPPPPFNVVTARGSQWLLVPAPALETDYIFKIHPICPRGKRGDLM